MRLSKRVIFIALGGIFLLLVPIIVKSIYLLHVINLGGIYAICVIGLTFTLGFTGQLSLGHAALMGIGAYTSALLAVDFNLPILVTLPAAILFTMLFGLVLGIPTLKLKSHYLAMATLGFNTIVLLVLRNWREVTHGADGIVNIPTASFWKFQVRSEQTWYYLILIVLIVCYIISKRIEDSRIGRSFKAIREGELAAEVMGIDTHRMKTLAFVLSAGWAGVAGSLFAHLNKFIAPNDFTLLQSIIFVSMAIIGGSDYLIGGVVGAFLLTLLPEYLRFLSSFSRLVHGLLIVLVMILAPSGLVGIIYKLRDYRRVHTKADSLSPNKVREI
jgi:branched-chain amino acid transport system permease protein